MKWNLIADIGGTNARFAAVIDGKICKHRKFNTKGDGLVIDAVAEFSANFPTAPERACLAVAGPVTATDATITNAGQVLLLSEVEVRLQCENVTFINDFEAASWAMVHLDANEVICLQGPQTPPKDGHRAVIGAGTGLGVGTLVRDKAQYSALAGEGGHIGISPRRDEDIAVFRELAKQWPEADFAQSPLRLEAEAFLSGTGLPVLYQAICATMGVEPTLNDAREIFEAAEKQTDLPAVQAIKTFQYYLASMAGDLAITISAKGGVILTGGVLMQNQWILNADFVNAFNDGGRFTKMRSEIPIYIYKSDQFGLQGAANAMLYKSD